MLQQLKHERRRDLVGRVSNANVKEGEVYFDGVAADQFELVLVTHHVYTFGHFGHHAGVDFDGDDLFASL